ncbi:hypothetical protein PCE1_003576 [Barthelona sp. PCE]
MVVDSPSEDKEISKNLIILTPQRERGFMASFKRTIRAHDPATLTGVFSNVLISKQYFVFLVTNIVLNLLLLLLYVILPKAHIFLHYLEMFLFVGLIVDVLIRMIGEGRIYWKQLLNYLDIFVVLLFLFALLNPSSVDDIVALIVRIIRDCLMIFRLSLRSKTTLAVRQTHNSWSFTAPI